MAKWILGFPKATIRRTVEQALNPAARYHCAAPSTAAAKSESSKKSEAMP
jgi:hypothetical protein